MRICRSCSPRPRSYLRSCAPGCCKPCCLPRRRCHSLSPLSRTPCLDDPCSSSPCTSPCDVCFTSSGRRCGARRCEPCSPRRYPRRRRSLSRKCSSPEPCQLSPCGTSCCVPGCTSCIPRLNPCSIGSCYSPICRPFYQSKSKCAPCYSSKCDPCVPRCYSTKCIPCYSSKCDPCYSPRYDPCYSPRYDPCYSPKYDPCYPWTCDPFYSPKCDPCFPRLRRLSNRCSAYSVGLCKPRIFCDPRNPCYSSLCGYCCTRRTGKCCPTSCFRRSAGSSMLRVGDLTCDKSRNVCRSSEVSTKPCSCETENTPCETASVDPAACCTEKGPSCYFLQKSSRLGKCLDRYDPHLCPWEADIAINGTVRGHCTSTALEVARRMSGRFKAEGDRFTKDSYEAPCVPDAGIQRLSLGRLDDGSSLNFSRNNIPNQRQDSEMPGNTCRSNESSSISCTDVKKLASRCRSSSRKEQKLDECDRCFHSANYRESLKNTAADCNPSISSPCERKNFEEIVGRKPCCSRRSSQHNVRFDSDAEALANHRTCDAMAGSRFDEDKSTSSSDIESFLKSRKNLRRRNRTSSRATSDRMQQRLSPAHRDNEHRSRLSVSPGSLALRHHTSPTISESDSSMFTPPTHYSPQCSRHYSESSPKENLDNITLHARSRTDDYLRHPQEVSLESGSDQFRNRDISYRREHRVDGIS